MNNYDKRIANIEQKHVQNILDKKEAQRTRVEIYRLDKEIEKLQSQRKELKSQLKGYQNSQFRMNLDLGFVPKSNMMRR